MSLAEKTRKVTEDFIASQNEKVQEVIVKAFKDLMNSSSGDLALNKGHQVKDFTLQNARGTTTTLSELLAQGPMVLSFYRGGWCPFCNLEFKALHDILPEIKSYGAQLVGVSPELPDQSMKTVERHQLKFEVLSDVCNKVAWQYGLVMDVHPQLRDYYLQWGFNLPELNGDDSFELPIPATYVIGENGIIHSAYINKDYTQRMEPEDILQSLQTL